MTLAEMRLSGRTIGAVSLDDGATIAAFQYTPEFAASRITACPGDWRIRCRTSSAIR